MLANFKNACPLITNQLNWTWLPIETLSNSVNLSCKLFKKSGVYRFLTNLSPLTFQTKKMFLHDCSCTNSEHNFQNKHRTTEIS